MAYIAEKPEWVDIAQRQPDTEVLAIGYQEIIMVGYCSKEGESYSCESEEGTILENVTHWMSLEELRSLLNLQKMRP